TVFVTFGDNAIYFQNLQNLQPLDDCLIGQMQENKKKNRYKNIMLVKDESFHYIACQGPLPTTLGDFWQMVWEQKSNVIAMMTQEHLENFVIRLIEVKDIQVSRTVKSPRAV
ncbi:tyrosine-protein phosphatase non-receptor type 13-like, partial [Astyanax mexicanus]